MRPSLLRFTSGTIWLAIRRHLTVALRLAALAVLLSVSLPATATSAPDARVSDSYGKLPLNFEPNHGQAGREVKFLSRGDHYSVFLTATAEAVLVFKGPARTNRATEDKTAEKARHVQAVRSALRMRLIGANREPRLSPLEELPGKSNYFLSNDPRAWRTNIPTYAKVKYDQVYPGIDLIWYGNHRQLEHDFVVSPGADPHLVAIEFQGTDRLAVDSSGDLVLHTAGGEVRQHRPLIYQVVDGVRHELAGRYVLKGRQRIGFQVAAYDRTRPLFIDPVLSYSTYLGGSGRDSGYGIAVDPAGNVYVAGSTASPNFPTANPLQPVFGGGSGDGDDAFVAKLNADGSALIYSTYLGGSYDDSGRGIAVDAFGNAYVSGETSSYDFPTSKPLQRTYGGGSNDAFVVKLNPTGSVLLYSTYLGGSGRDEAFDIAIDSSGSAYIAGETSSVDFPTVNPLQPALGGARNAFVTKLSPDGSKLSYSTYLGGSRFDFGNGIAVDGYGNAYVTGAATSFDFPTVSALQPGFGGGERDAFISKVNPTGSALVYSTYLGGNQTEYGYGIAVDASGSAYVIGGTSSPNFPTANALQPTSGGFRDVFVAKLNPAGSAFVYSTYLGGSGDDIGFGITVDHRGNVYMTGLTTSPNFPTVNALQPVRGGDINDVWDSDAFVAKLSQDGSRLLYSTYLGGSGYENDTEGPPERIAVDGAGYAYVTGETASPDFPTANPVQPTYGGGGQYGGDAFVAKIGDSATLCPGDCNGDHSVTVDELLTMVNIALGNVDLATCAAGDVNHDTQITIDEILTAVNAALNGCGSQ